MSVSLSKPSVVARVESRAVTTGEVIDTFEAMDGVASFSHYLGTVNVADRSTVVSRSTGVWSSPRAVPRSHR